MNLQTIDTTNGASPYDELGFQVVIDRQPGVPFPGGSPQNAALSIQANAVSGSGVFTVTPEGGASQNITFAIGETTAQTVANFAAAGLTASIVGTVATTAGKSQQISGSGNSLSIGGVNVDLVTPVTVANLMTAIRSANPTRTTLSGTGTITKAVAGLITAYTLSGAGTSAANGTYTETAANANPSAGVALYTKSGGVAYIRNDSGAHRWCHGPDLTNAEYYISQNYTSLAAAVAAGPIASFSVGFNGNAPVPTGTATATSGDAPATVNITLTDNASAGNVADLAVTGTGYNSTSSPPSGSSGIITATITNPAATAVTISRVSGNGWASGVQTAGTDGVVAPIFCDDWMTDFQEAEDWITQNPEGVKEDGYSALLRQWTTVSGNLKPEYDALFWKFLCMFGMPIRETPVTVNGTALVEYEFRLPAFGSVERPTFTGQWGRPDNSFRAAYGIIQTLSITNAANGNTEGNMAIMLKNGTPNNVMLGHGANEIQTLTVTALTGTADITIPATPLGAGGVVTITGPDMTAVQLRALLGNVPSIRRRGNVRVSGGIAGGNGVFQITFINQIALQDIPMITSSNGKVVITEATKGKRIVAVPQEDYPIVPKHWFYKEGTTRVAALAAPKIIDVETHEVTFTDLANPHYTENQSETFKDHVDGATGVTCNIGIAYDDDPDSDCARMESEAKEWTSRKKWRIFGADAPDLLRQLRIGVYASVNAARPRGNENNVYRKNFPMTRKRNHNATEGYSFFATLRIPPQNI